MKNLHIISNTTFTNPYIDFINNNFNDEEHLFLIIGKGMKLNIISQRNVKQLTKKNIFNLFYLIKQMNSYDQIILHGLFYPQVVLILYVQPWLLKKCNWVIWGGDLYEYKFRIKTFKSNIYEFIRTFVIKNINGLITHVKGDYELAKLWYGAKGKYYYCFEYPSNLFKEYDFSKINKDYEKMYIQVGNSADPANNHIEVFEKLSTIKNEKIEIICPLSYGDIIYRNKVIEKGIQIFGEKFTPILDFMPYSEYLEVLAKIDIAIFNHKRQQALGNIITLIGLGKKVYIRDDITTWEFCEMHDLSVYNFNGSLQELLKKIEFDSKLKNMENIKKRFSQEKLKYDWEIIFSSSTNKFLEQDIT